MGLQSHLGLPCILCLVAATASTSASAVGSSAARLCGVDMKKAAGRIFANPDGKHGWREYRTVKDVPEVELGFGEFARVWAGNESKTFVRTEEPGEDFSSYTDYCFDKAGNLLHVRFELRTAWGWGYRNEGSIQNGVLSAGTSEFFGTENGKPIPKPDQANDVPDALNPRLYLREAQLPFWKLMSR
jgi:hypothetical protein